MLRRLLVTLCALLGFGLVGEGVFRLLPVSTSTQTGYYIDADILTYPAGHQWRVSTGWDLRNPQTLRANNLGFAAHRDFVPNPKAVALIGDSFVEESMLDAADRPGMQLERALGGRPVYAMGSPGTALLDFAVRIRYARQTLGVRDIVVFLDAGDVLQSLCGSGNVHAACLHPRTLQPRTERLPDPDTVKRLLRNSALAQYLVGQLRANRLPGDVMQALRTAWQTLLQGKQATTPSPVAMAAANGADSPAADAAVTAVVAAFFERVGPPRPGERLVFLLDGRHEGLDVPLKPAVAAVRQRLVDALHAQGYALADAEEAYARHYRSSARSLNVGPYDKHLNPEGVRVAMEAAAALLR